MKITRYGFLVLAVLALAGLLNAQTYTDWGDGAKPEESKALVKPTAAGPGANVTGQDNVAVGGDAGRLTESGVENKDPTGSVYIGAFTKGKAPGVVNEIVIGHSAVGAGSNTVTIGNASTTATYLKGNVVIPGVATIATPTLNIHASNKGYVDALVVSFVGAVSIPGNASFTLSGLGSKAFTELTGIPTTIAGYGLTDAASTTALSDHTGATTGVHGAPADTRFLTASETIDASQIPSEIARDTEIPNNASFTLGGLGTKAFSELTDIPTTIADYGLTDAASTTALSDHTGATTGVHGAPADTRFATASEAMQIDGSNASDMVTLKSLRAEFVTEIYDSAVRSDKDAEGLFTTISYYDATPTLRKKSVLSGGTSPSYTTRTVSLYDAAGGQVATYVYTQSYDGDDNWTGEELP